MLRIVICMYSLVLSSIFQEVLSFSRSQLKVEATDMTKRIERGKRCYYQRQYQGFSLHAFHVDVDTLHSSVDIYLARLLPQIISSIVTYISCVAYVDRPRGQLIIDDEENSLLVRPSRVEGAGLGLFAGTFISKGTVLGTYPGVIRPLGKYRKKLDKFYRSSDYAWVNQVNAYVIDPTDSIGELQDICTGGTDDYPFSEWILQNVFTPFHKSTKLARINEPVVGVDCNIFTAEDEENRKVRFIAARDIYEGEEFYIDYGRNYDRSGYKSTT